MIEVTVSEFQRALQFVVIENVDLMNFRCPTPEWANFQKIVPFLFVLLSSPGGVYVLEKMTRFQIWSPRTLASCRTGADKTLAGFCNRFLVKLHCVIEYTQTLKLYV